MFSCSGESNSDSDTSLPQSLENTQWVFDNYEILGEAEPTRGEEPFYDWGEFGVDFTMEEIESLNNQQWKDFIIIFKSNNVGLIKETIYLTEDELYPMDWLVVDKNTIRIIYKRQPPQSRYC